MRNRCDRKILYIYDLDDKVLTEFKTSKDYEDFAAKMKLPLTNEIGTFREII